MDHYYHFAAELLLGAWRAHCAYDQEITPYGETKLSPPSRIWFMHQDEKQWYVPPPSSRTIVKQLTRNTKARWTPI